MTPTILHGDCISEMMNLPPASVDLVLADVPYGKTRNRWDQIIPFDEMWNCIWRVAKPNAAVVLMAAQPFASHLVCSRASEFRYDLIWHKNKATGFLNAKRQPMRAHEHLLVFYRSQPTFNPQKTTGHPAAHVATQTSHGQNYGRKTKAISSGGNTDRFPVSVLKVPIVNNDSAEKIHPTQKPVELMAWIIRSFSKPGDVVLDFAAGSGTTAIAALREGRRSICIENDRGYFVGMQARVARAQTEMKRA